MKTTSSVYPFISIVFSLLCLLGCSAHISQNKLTHINTINSLYADAIFPKAVAVNIESEEDIFALDDKMRNMVNDVLKRERNYEKKARLLLAYIFSSNHISMSYEQGANVKAIDAFHGSKANCISLTIMAYALAKNAGMKINFQHIKIPEYWVRSGEHQLLMGHVNLVIKKPRVYFKEEIWSNDILEIDFDPEAAKSSFTREVVSKKMIVAMFYNNKAAEALIKSNYDEAYAYLKAATISSPLYYSNWGNLGVLYKMTKQYELAINAYQFALTLNPNNSTSLENLALLYKKLGKLKKSEQINKTLHAKRLRNPHYHALLSNDAAHQGKYISAINHLKKAIKLNSTFHEFYFNLSNLYYKTDELTLAKSAIKKALRYNTNKVIEYKYNQKLNFLKQAAVNY